MQPEPGSRIIRTACPAHNCGGRCLLQAHVADGRIVRLETDDRPEDPSSPEIRPAPACAVLAAGSTMLT